MPHNKLVFLLVSTVVLSLLSRCTKPVNPYTQYENVRVELEPEDAPDEGFHIGDTLRARVAINLPGLVDSVVVTAATWDTTAFPDPDRSNNDTLVITWIVQNTGTVEIEAIAFLSNETIKRVTAVVEVKGYPPTITRDLPASLNKTEQEACTLSVVVVDSSDISYTWLHNGDTLSDKNASSLVIASVSAGDSGAYQCLAANQWGTTSSSETRLIVRSQDAPTAPQNLRLVDRSETAVTVLWDAVTGAQEYRIYRDTLQNSDIDVLGTTQGTSYTDNGPGDYFYWVTAVKNGFESFVSSTIYAGSQNQAPSWSTASLAISLSEGEDTLLSIAGLCTDPNSDDTLTYALITTDAHGALSGDSAYAFSAGRLDSGVYIEKIAASDGELSDTLTITVTVLPTYVTLSLTAENGSISKSPDASRYRRGDTVSLTATPESGYTFIGWSGDIGGSESTTTVIMDADKSVTATLVSIAIAECQIISQGSSINAKIREIATSSIGQGTICPEEGRYDSETIGIRGTVKVRILK